MEGWQRLRRSGYLVVMVCGRGLGYGTYMVGKVFRFEVRGW